MVAFIVIRTFTISPGKLDGLRQALPELIKMIEAKDQRRL